MIVRWTQPAADDLLHICDYTAERFGASQARRLADAIFETATSLQDMPNRGRKGCKRFRSRRGFLQKVFWEYALRRTRQCAWR